MDTSVLVFSEVVSSNLNRHGSPLGDFVQVQMQIQKSWEETEILHCDKSLGARAAGPQTGMGARERPGEPWVSQGRTERAQKHILSCRHTRRKGRKQPTFFVHLLLLTLIPKVTAVSLEDIQAGGILTGMWTLSDASCE